MTNTQYALISLLMISSMQLNCGSIEGGEPLSEIKARKFQQAVADPNKTTLSEALMYHQGEIYFEQFQQLVHMSEGIVDFDAPVYNPRSFKDELLLIGMIKIKNYRHALCLLEAGARNVTFNGENPLQVAQEKYPKETYNKHLLEEVIKKLKPHGFLTLLIQHIIG